LNYLYIITGIALLTSFITNRRKTYKAVKIALTQIFKIVVPFFTMIILVAIILYLIPENLIVRYLSNGNKYISAITASFIGSATLMPGFIAYPLSGILLKKGVSYFVLSAFTTTIMMVGILTFPIEKKYFGFKVSFIRNLIGYIIAILVALFTGLIYGELF